MFHSHFVSDGLDLDLFFRVVGERLKNPEREVRQHALRVLTSFIPVINCDHLDDYMRQLMPEIVANLGHIGPAVRKGAVDCLRAYMTHSDNSDDTLRDLANHNVEQAAENKVQSNVVAGTIIALPFLTVKATNATLKYIIQLLFEKMEQVALQEMVLRSLVRLKQILGDRHFEELCRHMGESSSKRKFDLLCDLYSLNSRSLVDEAPEVSPTDSSKIYWSDMNQNVVEDEAPSWNDLATATPVEIVRDKVILETEIQLDSGSAITMQVHEESRQVADGEDEAR